MWPLILFLASLALFIISTYNKLIILRQRVKNAWAQVDVQLKRRYDLIPNLVKSVRGYATHERETFEELTRARSNAIQASGAKDASKAESELSGTLRTLFAVAENYPELKADANFRHLQTELSDTETKIGYARQFFNDTVQKFNIQVRVFPSNLVASFFGFQEESFFSVPEGSVEREVVSVDF